MSGLKLTAGRHHIRGAQALAFWRTREDLGFGSDLQRIQRDQLLMASLVQGIERSGLLNSPTKVLGVVKDAADAMTTDSTLEQSQMLQIATSLKGLSSQSVQFITAPNEPYVANNQKVQLQQPQADELFHAIAHDTKLPKTGKSKKSQHAVTTPVLDTTPSKVNVNVLNGAGINGLAGQAGSDLTARGFNVVSTGDASTTGYTNPVIEYASSADLPAVNTLKAQLSGVTVQKSDHPHAGDHRPDRRVQLQRPGRGQVIGPRRRRSAASARPSAASPPTPTSARTPAPSAGPLSPGG